MNAYIEDLEINELKKIASMTSKMKHPVDLSIGVPDFEVPIKIKQAAIDAINNNRNSYTPPGGLNELKERIVSKLKNENDITVKPGGVMVTTASSGALSLVFMSLLNPGDEIIIFDPYYPAYRQLTLQYHGNPICARTRSDFSPDLEDLGRKISEKTKAVVINSPNNPTGKVYEKNQLNDLADILRKHKLLVISDEVYEKFTFEKSFHSIAAIYNNTITINGFSKSYGMAGWRLGYMTGPPEIITRLVALNFYNSVCAPTPFQYAAIKAFDLDMKAQINACREKRDILCEGLKDYYDFEKTEGAFYTFIKYPSPPEEFLKRCIANELLVLPGSCCSQFDTHFRVSFAVEMGALKKAIQILKKIR